MGEMIINRGRGPEIAGSRITAFDVLEYTEAGWSSRDIAAVLRLSPEQVEAAARYIADHRPEVEAGHRAILERIDRGNPAEIEEKRRASHERLQAMLRARTLERARVQGGC